MSRVSTLLHNKKNKVTIRVKNSHNKHIKIAKGQRKTIRKVTNHRKYKRICKILFIPPV